MKFGKELIQFDVEYVFKTLHCDSCLKAPRDWEPPPEDHYGAVLVDALYATNGDLIAFLCPECAAPRREEDPEEVDS